MIKNIQEFKNTYVKNTPELRKAFLAVADKFGIRYRENCGVANDEDCLVAFWCDIDGVSFKVGCWYAYADRIKGECRELTLSDLKQHARTEYEKVTESIFDLRDEFERGDLYFDRDRCTGGIYASSDQYQKIRDMNDFSQAALNNNIYRKVEKEIDWRDEVVHAYPSIDFKDIDSDGYRNLGSWRPDKFLELCRVALRANGELD